MGKFRWEIELAVRYFLGEKFSNSTPFWLVFAHSSISRINLLNRRLSSMRFKTSHLGSAELWLEWEDWSWFGNLRVMAMKPSLKTPAQKTPQSFMILRRFNCGNQGKSRQPIPVCLDSGWSAQDQCFSSSPPFTRAHPCILSRLGLSESKFFPQGVNQSPFSLVFPALCACSGERKEAQNMI